MLSAIIIAMEVPQGANQESSATPIRLKPLQEVVTNSGRFSKIDYLEIGASGVAFRVIDKESDTPALLKVAEGTELTSDLFGEYSAVSGRSNFEGLNQVASYPAAQLPTGQVSEPTMRGLAKTRNSQEILYIGSHPAILLEWLEETKVGEPGYHRLDKLIQEKSKTWTDLEILEIIAPFAYLLAKAHEQGIIYNDIGADKANHLYWDETKHQLKVIDWANVVDMTRASYQGKRQPYHDVIGLVKLIYTMRTGENPRSVEGQLNAAVWKSKLLLSKHSELANLVRDCLEEQTITDGSGLYTAIETSIKSLRQKSRPQSVTTTDQSTPPPVPPVVPPTARIHIRPLEPPPPPTPDTPPKKPIRIKRESS